MEEALCSESDHYFSCYYLCKQAFIVMDTYDINCLVIPIYVMLLD